MNNVWRDYQIRLIEAYEQENRNLRQEADTLRTIIKQLYKQLAMVKKANEDLKDEANYYKEQYDILYLKMKGEY